MHFGQLPSFRSGEYPFPVSKLENVLCKDFGKIWVKINLRKKQTLLLVRLIRFIYSLSGCVFIFSKSLLFLLNLSLQSVFVVYEARNTPARRAPKEIASFLMHIL